MPPESIRALSISALKSILFTNHVNVGNILEKGDLVGKVLSLVEDEKKERDRMRLVGEMEEMERIQREREREGINVDGFPPIATEEGPSRTVVSEEERHADPIMDNHEETHHTQTENLSQSNVGAQETKPNAPAVSNISISALERNGLCVVCQDEEANIAIVDCGFVPAIPGKRPWLITLFAVTWRCVEIALTSS